MRISDNSRVRKNYFLSKSISEASWWPRHGVCFDFAQNLRSGIAVDSKHNESVVKAQNKIHKRRSIDAAARETQHQRNGNSPATSNISYYILVQVKNRVLFSVLSSFITVGHSDQIKASCLQTTKNGPGPPPPGFLTASWIIAAGIILLSTLVVGWWSTTAEPGFPADLYRNIT